MRKRILLVCDVKGWGGWERAERIKKHLSDEFDFDMMDSNEFKEWEAESDKDFIHVNDLNYLLNKFQPVFTKQMLPIKEMLKYKESKCTIKKRPYDLYYLMFHTMLCAQDIKRVMYTDRPKVFTSITGQPVVKEVFGNEKYTNTPRAAFEILSQQCAGLAANNMISLNELSGLYDGPKYYIPRGVDPDFWYDMGDATWNMEDTAGATGGTVRKFFTALFCGKDRSGKGLNRFIKPSCSYGDGKHNVVLLQNERNYTNALNKVQMREWYNQGHVYCVASETDGTPNPALEAAACGRPIITNRVGNMPEFIKDGWNGFLIDRDVIQYRQKIQWLQSNIDDCREMGRNARKTVIENWTWEHSMEHERKALRELLK